jgi:hypothetical protein
MTCARVALSPMIRMVWVPTIGRYLSPGRYFEYSCIQTRLHDLRAKIRLVDGVQQQESRYRVSVCTDNLNAGVVVMKSAQDGA